jgi:hypothetical protein
MRRDVEALPVHYALHYTFITRPPYTCSRKDEWQVGVQGAMKSPPPAWDLPEHVRAGQNVRRRGNEL